MAGMLLVLAGVITDRALVYAGRGTSDKVQVSVGTVALTGVTGMLIGFAIPLPSGNPSRCRRGAPGALVL